MLNLDFLEKDLAIDSLPHFVYDFWRKTFMLYSINWPHCLIVFLLEILINMCIAIVCEPGLDVIKFEISLVFLMKLFSYMTKKSEKNPEISWEWKELLKRNKKHFSSILKGFSCQNLSKTWECAFKIMNRTTPPKTQAYQISLQAYIEILNSFIPGSVPLCIQHIH